MAFEQFGAGRCSFCAKPAGDTCVLAGLATRPWRVCPECIELGRDLIADDIRHASAPKPRTPAPPIDPEQILAELAAQGAPAHIIESTREAFALAAMSPQERRAALARRGSPAQHMCSFCDAPRRTVLKLIAGPDGVFICDRCIEAAATALAG